MARPKTHGMRYTSEYESYHKMKSRCLNPNHNRYKNYGGRGIMICKRWLKSFENFFEDMGKKPSEKHSLDRIDNDGDYSPSNCRWATQTEQQNNRSNNHIIFYKGAAKTLTQWAFGLGINRQTLSTRLRRGWSIKRALTTNKAGAA